MWWNYNRHRFLDVRGRLARSVVATGSDDFYLGRGQEDSARDVVVASDHVLARELVPLLVETLRGKASQDVLSSALVALAKSRRACKLAEVAPVDVIAPLLVDGNLEVSETAAIALGILGRDTDLALLELLVRDDVAGLRERYRLSLGRSVPERVRAFAAYGLGIATLELDEYHQLVVARRLHDTLEDELAARASDEVAAACVLSLGLVQLPLDPADSRAEPERHKVLASSSQAVRYLVALLDAPQASTSVRAQVPLSLARLAEALPRSSPLRAAVVERLLALALARASETELRRSAVLGLGRLGGTSAELDERVYAALRETAHSAGDVQVRGFALVSLGEASGAGSFQPARDGAQEELLQALARGSLETRAWAALGLGLQQRLRRERNQTLSAGAAAALRVELADAKSSVTAGAVAIALGLSGDPAASEVLLARLARESDPRAKGHVCLALGLLDVRDAAEPILAIARSARYQPELLGFAAISLGLLADRAGIATLIELLQQSSSLASQAGLASALGKLGDARAIEPLLEVCRDPSRPELVRAFALVALGGIADDRPLPWNEPLSRGINYRAGRPTLTSPVDARGVLDIL
jgi:HEAT repeat protein